MTFNAAFAAHRPPNANSHVAVHVRVFTAKFDYAATHGGVRHDALTSPYVRAHMLW